MDSPQGFIRDTGSVFETFNDTHTWDDILAPHGYERVGEHRWVGPMSEGGTPGVHRLPFSNHIFVHHSVDPLNPFGRQRAHDKFSAWCQLNHAGILEHALRELECEQGLLPARSDAGGMNGETKH